MAFWQNAPSTQSKLNATNLNNLAGGWTKVIETLTYASADSPTFVINTSADLTSFLSVGMKLKLTQTTVKYFIITAITSSTITVYGGTDYTLTNTTISDVYFSPHKTPYGFPLYMANNEITIFDMTNPALNFGKPNGIITNTDEAVNSNNSISYNFKPFKKVLFYMRQDGDLSCNGEINLDSVSVVVKSDLTTKGYISVNSLGDTSYGINALNLTYATCYVTENKQKFVFREVGFINFNLPSTKYATGALSPTITINARNGATGYRITKIIGII